MFRIGPRLLRCVVTKSQTINETHVFRALLCNSLAYFCRNESNSNIMFRGTSSPRSEEFEDISNKEQSSLGSGKYKLRTIPNALCVGRIAATPIIGYFVIQHEFSVAFVLFMLAGVTDMLDGFIARNVPGQKSLFGSVLDPISDKLLASVMFFTMSYVALVPWQLTAVVLIRDLCLIIGGFYKRYRNLEPPYSLRRFFDPEVSSMQVVPTRMSKINTVLQLSLIASSLSIPVFNLGEICTSLSIGLCWATAFTTIYSGMQYVSGQALKKV